MKSGDEETMQAVRLFAPGDVRCVRIEVPRLERPDQVLIKVKSCGVCGSDIPRVMVKGAYYHPITIGHEFAGEIVEVGSGAKGFFVGDRVTVMPLIPCGACDYCRVGDYNMCESYGYYGSRNEGAMAEYIAVEAANLLRLPESVDYESGSMTDPASVALHALRGFSFLPGRSAIVFGLGAIGLFAVQWLRVVGASEVIAVDIFDDKLALASELGASFTINGRKEDVVAAVLDRTGGAGADNVVEIIGNPATQLQAIRVAAKHARIVFCGISYDTLSLPYEDLNKILRRELTISGAWNSSIAPFPINEWKSALDAMASGRLLTKPLVTHRFNLADATEVFRMLHGQKISFTKVLFKPEGV